VITRFEVLKFRRKMARDRHVFHENVMELLAGAAEELDGSGRSEDYRNALQECIKALPEKSRRLIRAAYADDRTIREVADDVGQSATAFYKTLNRIREKLRQCVQQRLDAT
jgi:RNA polymerase sigma-70 factor (ECF subfamily)